MLPLDAYPRPQLKRDSYLCLNGPWEFAVIRDSEPPKQYPDSILVPYPPESEASGICRRIIAGETMHYRRTFALPEGFIKDRVLLHFGAVDQTCSVMLNGTLLGSHEGGYLPFSFDITEHLKSGENVLTVKAFDPLDHTYPWGKQKHKNGGMWYTPFSGIWQTVWLESVPDPYITGLKITPSLTSVRLELSDNAPVSLETELEIETPFETLHWSFFGNVVDVPIPNPVLWTPEHPHLYPMTIRRDKDTVHSYFALRTISVETVDKYSRILLNGKPYFFHGLLDQGYWKAGICLPPDNEGYEKDIRYAKSLGFNTLRKHIRIEPLPFYETCDRLGMIVFQDCVNNGTYHFFRDTILPTIGIQKLDDRNFRKKDSGTKVFKKTMLQTVRHLFNCPCIVYWTIFNEGWGQFQSDAMYALLKSSDETRIVDSTSGWFWQKESDVDSYHVYFRAFRQKAGKRPLVLSEFGGYAYSAKGKQYGYRFFKTREAYRKAIEDLYRMQIIPAVKTGLCAAIYTQISDVEEEQNGIMTYDRTEQKLLSRDMLKIADRLKI